MIDPLSRIKFPENFLEDIATIQNQLKDGADNWLVGSGINSPALVLIQTVPSTSIATATEITIPWATTNLIIDTSGGFDFTNDQYLITSSQYYQLNFDLTVNGNVVHPAASVTFTLKLNINGTAVYSVDLELPNAAATGQIGFHFPIYLNDGDLLDFSILHDYGSAINIQNCFVSWSLFRIII